MYLCAVIFRQGTRLTLQGTLTGWYNTTIVSEVDVQPINATSYTLQW